MVALTNAGRIVNWASIPDFMAKEVVENYLVLISSLSIDSRLFEKVFPKITFICHDVPIILMTEIAIQLVIYHTEIYLIVGFS